MKNVFDEIIEKFKEIGDVRFNSFSKMLIPVEDAIKIVNDVATEYNNGWIPVTERMPEEHEVTQNIYDYDYDLEGEVLVDFEDYMTSDSVLVTVQNKEKGKLFVCENDTINGKWDYYSRNGYEVLAWQPLPEPYKIQQEKEET